MNQQKPTYVIGFEGSGNNARPLIQTMLEVSAVHITATWIISDDVPANVVICEPAQHSETGQHYYNVKVALGGKPDPVVFALPKPFRLMQLIELLNNAESHFEVNYKPAEDALVANGTWAKFAEFLTRELGVQHETGFITLKLDGAHVATIDIAAQNYYRVANLIKIVSYQNTLEYAHQDEFPLNPELDGVSPFPLENLVWLAGLVAGGGIAAPWLPDSSHFILKSWPNFAMYNHNMKMIEMSAKLTKQPKDVATLAKEVEASESMVWNFMNAVSLLGICQAAEPEEDAELSKKPASGNGDPIQSNVSSLIGKLKQHLMRAG